MAGGGSMQGSAQNGANTAMAQALQNFPIVPNSQSFGAGAQPTAQSVSQLQQILQKMGAGGANSPAMRMSGMGMGLMQQGQGQVPHPQAPMARPMGMPAPMQAAQTPQMMTGGMGMGGMAGNGQVNPQLLRAMGLM